MKSNWLGFLLVGGFLLAAAAAFAQEKPSQPPQNPPPLQSYDRNRESTLVGTVISYTSASKTPPLGPHVSLQTPSGLIDIHLGDARLLAANHFIIEPGDILRIVGENIAYPGGTQFIGRIVQKGSQALLLRTLSGFPISSSTPRNMVQPPKQGSAL